MTGLPVLQIVVEPDRIARYGINAADVMTVVETLGGAEATQILEGQRRFAAGRALSREVRRDTESIAKILVSAPGGERVPLGSLARIEEIEGPAEISHVNGSRLILVEGNVRGRDIGSFVDAVRELFDGKTVRFRPATAWSSAGSSRTWSGRGPAPHRRAAVPVPDLPAAVLDLQSLRQALLVFTRHPPRRGRRRLLALARAACRSASRPPSASSRSSASPC